MPSFTSDAIFSPLDGARAAVLRRTGRTSRRFFVDREARVALYAVTSITFSFVLTCAAPLWLIAVGPILLGVPHLLADFRYLVVRPGLHARPGFWWMMAFPAVLTWIWPTVSMGLVACAGAILLARGSRLSKVVACVAWLGVFALARLGGRTSDIVFAHLHNLVAVALWLTWARRTQKLHAWVLGLFLVAGAAIFSGFVEQITWKMHGFDFPGNAVEIDRLVRTLSPFADPYLGLRLVLFFAFAQAVHYAIWLRWIPEEDRPRAGMRTFASSYRALVEDVGAWPLFIFAIVTVVLVGWALFDLRAARDGYLRMAIFHGHLEIAVAMLLLLEGRRARAV